MGLRKDGRLGFLVFSVFRPAGVYSLSGALASFLSAEFRRPCLSTQQSALLSLLHEELSNVSGESFLGHEKDYTWHPFECLLLVLDIRKGVTYYVILDEKSGPNAC